VNRRLGLGVILVLGCTAPGGKDHLADDTGDDTGTIPEGVVLPTDCSALPAAPGETVAVTAADADTLRDRVAGAAPGTTFLLADGTYPLTGGDAASNLAVPAGVTLRSASGNAAAVVLEGGYATSEIVTLAGDGATLAELTVSHASSNGVSIRGVNGARVYGVSVVDAGGIGIAVLPERGAYSDDAVIGCATVTRTETCDVGIDTVQARGTYVHGVTVDQPGCDDPGLRFATGSRDTVVERSRVFASGLVGLALGKSDYAEGEERVYADAGCPDRTLVGHYGGIVRNVFVAGAGIRVEDACGGTVAHASVWGGDVAWAFSEELSVVNDLASLSDGGGATATGNRTPTAADFADAAGGDLHLVDSSGAIDAGGVLAAGVADDDIDGDARVDGAPDVGADER
jgi:hypothetical protein